jgi:hypothetical protein
MNNRKRLLLCAILSAFLLSPILLSHTWSRAALGQDSVALQNRQEQFPIVDSTKPEPANPRERAKRRLKGKKYNKDQQSVGPMIVQATDGFQWPADFSAIPAEASDAVIVGEVSSAEAFLSEDSNSVYSEFTVRLAEVLKNESTSLLAPGNSVTTERKGGRVRYPSGHISWLFVAGQGMPRVGRRYVFFLKQNDQDQDFQILTLYELREDRVIPIDFSPGVVHFERYAGSDPGAFLNEVRVVISKCSILH